MWNSELVTRLEAWYSSPQGAFALEQQHHLLQRLTSQWPRRNHTIVNPGCGSGVFLEMLWYHGFEVTGVDTESDSLELAQELAELIGNDRFRIKGARELPPPQRRFVRDDSAHKEEAAH